MIVYEHIKFLQISNRTLQEILNNNNMIRKYAKLDLFPIRFDNEIPHQAASNDIAMDILFDSGNPGTIPPNAVLTPFAVKSSPS